MEGNEKSLFELFVV